MESRIVSFIQIGDVHLPDFSEERIVDDKDRAFSRELLERIAPKRLECVMKALVRLLEEKHRRNPSAILIGGDLTSKGDYAAYTKCVEYLCTSLRLKDSARWITSQIHVVPGNHDVDRKAVDSSKPLYEKFALLENAWTEQGLSVFTNEAARHTQIITDVGRLDLYSINSCLGCGTKDYLPSKIRDQLHDLLSKTDYSIHGMQLDTPAFDQHALDDITDSIESLTPTTLPVVLSHHNILPQQQPRIEMYTEAINGGLVRSRLSQLKRPVIYCHGHLHADPVEVLISPRAGRGRLISISAPLLSDGFNLVEIHYSRSGAPIGCVVVPYRLQNDAAVQKDTPIKIPLWGQRDYMRFSNDSLFSPILDEVGADPRRFKSLHSSLKGASDITEHELSDVLIELEWAGIVAISNREDQLMHWQIHRTEP